MGGKAILNPLTVALGGPDGREVLTLRSFARGRSLVDTVICRAEQPDVFDALLGWIEHGQPDHLTGLSREQHFHFWGNGLLISEGEARNLPPHARPGYDADALAATLYPPVADFLARPFVPQGPGEAALSAFRSDRACLLPALFTAPELAIVQGYYRLLQEGSWLKPDHHLTTQKVAKNDPVARHVHAGIAPLVAELAGEAVLPTFSYAVEYHGGADLPRHTDRVQCTWTVSVYVDFLPEPAEAKCPWPLVVHAEGRDQAFRPDPGGAILIHGTAVEHSRPPLAPGEHALQFMLCFAPGDFAGSLV